ncbi:MAG: AmmeMemoRadiSam system radical SAM enzyme [Candidatus Micrarchaeota archaeon]
MKEAILYKKFDDAKVSCFLCSRRCVIPNGKRGYCGVRENKQGTLYSLVWGRACSYAIDPIEKKPFYHFFPGTRAFSIATVGCTFHCAHCQNWEISQPGEIYGENYSPEEVLRLSGECEGIAYTYTEPTIFMEYALDIAKLAREKGKYNVFVTNGYMTPEAIREMKLIDASRIDLKSMRDKFYKEVCGASLEPVLESIKLLHKKGHVELINLIIPGKNDSEEELRELSKWVCDLDSDIPLHFTVYHPAHKLFAPPTPAKTVERARAIAIEEGVHFAYAGNLPGHPGENTYCYNCNELLIERTGFFVSKYSLGKDKLCKKCGTKIKIVDVI